LELGERPGQRAIDARVIAYQAGVCEGQYSTQRGCVGIGVVTADNYVVLVILFSGMLGAAIRVNYSFYKHLGFSDFSFNWSWFYLLLPFFGAAWS